MNGTAPRTFYLAKVGQYTASSDARQNERQLLSLVVERGMDGPVARCSVELGGTGFGSVAAGSAVVIRLGADGSARDVFTGETYAGEITPVSQVALAADGLAKLASIQIEKAYQAVSADFIIADLLQQAGVQHGALPQGPRLPAFAVHRQSRVLRHLESLAALCGADLFTDGGGKVQVAVPKQGMADHSFTIGETVLNLDLRQTAPAFDGIELWGEGAASSKGSDKAHWLATDLSGVTARASIDAAGTVAPGKAGAHTLHVRDGAVRSGGVAQDIATAHAGSRAARLLRGTLGVVGAPQVEPGDLVAIRGLPADHAAAGWFAGGHALRVRGVRHILDRARGFRTRLEF